MLLPTLTRKRLTNFVGRHLHRLGLAYSSFVLHEELPLHADIRQGRRRHVHTSVCYRLPDSTLFSWRAHLIQ